MHRDSLIGTATNWWLRSANSAEQMRNVNTNGNLNSNNATTAWICPRPASAETYGLEARERRLPLKKRYYMIPTLEQIDRAQRKVWRGKTNTDRCHKYRYYREDHAFRILEDVTDNDFHPKPMGMKRIDIPKPRLVQVPSVRDKVIMHALCDNVIYDAVAAQLGNGVSACLIGRGTEYGTNRMIRLLKEFWTEHKAVPWILKGDVHAYFASVKRERVAELAGQVIQDPDALRISRAYTFYDGKPTGMPLGLQQNQCFGNLYLASLDRLITVECGYATYGRHMDDFYVIAPTRAELERLLARIEAHLTSIGLSLNPKTAIERGRIDFLGFTHIVTKDGKILLRLQNGKKKAKKRELKMIVRKLAAGELTLEKVQQRYQGWRQRVLRAGCRNVVFEMDRHFVLFLHKAGYRTRTTKKGVEIIAQSD